MMNGLIRSLLVTSLICFSGKLMSQELALEIDRVYGLDPLLYNGKKYYYFLPAGTGGNQFLSSADFLKGDMVIRGLKFSGVSMNYDIYNQKLLLQYNDETEATSILEVSEAWLESFHLGEQEYKLLDFANDQRFYQVLGDGPLFILYYWRKELKLDPTSGAHKYNFGPSVKKRFVLIDGELLPFSNKRGLVSLFDAGQRPEIKNYMKSKKIKMKQASDQAMTELINFIGNLY